VCHRCGKPDQTADEGEKLIGEVVLDIRMSGSMIDEDLAFSTPDELLFLTGVWMLGDQRKQYAPIQESFL